MVRKYAEKYLIHKAAGTTLEGAEESLAVQKTQREIKRIETQEAHERFKLDLLRGKYLKKSDVYAEWAARAVVIDRGLEYMIEANLAKMIVMVGGDQQKAPQLLEYLIEQKNIQMNEFANMENFRVVMELEEESENVI
ncbi:hypothetical protein [Desulforhopalus singaporensis]|nr:hypothetical protein [Desulforhopalus singaporensis]